MGFFDDLQAKASEAFDSASGRVQQSILDYNIDLDKVLDPIEAKITGKKRGEATAQELAQGIKSVPEPVAAPAGDRVRRDQAQGDPLKNQSLLEKFPMIKPIGIGLAVFAVGMVLLKRR